MLKLLFHSCCIAVLVLTAMSRGFAQTSLPFSLPTGASETFLSGDFSGPLNSGFAKIQPNLFNTAPEGFGIIQHRSNGILISETTVPASSLVTSSDTFFVEIQGSVNTGVAIANPNQQEATISFGFQVPEIRRRGGGVGMGSFTIPPNSQIARFINEPPFNWPAPYFGWMQVQSSIPMAITAFRGLTNERSEFLITTILQGEPAPGCCSPRDDKRIVAGYIPRFADGGGWQTEIVLRNTNSEDLAVGTLDFIGPSGEPLPVTIDGKTASSFDFGINFGDFFRITTAGAGPETKSGYVRITAGPHSSRFIGFAIYSYKNSGATVSATSLPMVQPGAAFRLYVDETGDFAGQLQTGIAITNPSAIVSEVSLELIDENGAPTELTGTIQIPSLGQLAKFLKEIPGFETVPFPFRGVLRIATSNPNGIVASGVRGRLNERSDFLVTPVPLAVEDSSAAPAGEKLLLHVAQGGGYSTEVVLFNASSGSVSTGNVSSVSSTGGALPLSANEPK